MYHSTLLGPFGIDEENSVVNQVQVDLIKGACFVQKQIIFAFSKAANLKQSSFRSKLVGSEVICTQVSPSGRVPCSGHVQTC